MVQASRHVITRPSDVTRFGGAKKIPHATSAFLLIELQKGIQFRNLMLWKLEITHALEKGCGQLVDGEISCWNKNTVNHSL